MDLCVWMQKTKRDVWFPQAYHCHFTVATPEIWVLEAGGGVGLAERLEGDRRQEGEMLLAILVLCHRKTGSRG